MREIKFRAWDNKWKVMLHWFHIKNQQNKERDIGKICFVTYPSSREDIPTSNQNNEGDYELMQFTGLKDKKGKEIYEGDIIDWIYLNNGCPYKLTGEVEFINLSFCIRGHQVLSEFKGLNSIDERYGLRIIGNIYEDKELIK